MQHLQQVVQQLNGLTVHRVITNLVVIVIVFVAVIIQI
jgi:hypothetical protein